MMVFTEHFRTNWMQHNVNFLAESYKLWSRVFLLLDGLTYQG